MCLRFVSAITIYRRVLQWRAERINAHVARQMMNSDLAWLSDESVSELVNAWER